MIRVAYCVWTVCPNNDVYVKHLLSSLESGILAYVGRWCPCDQPRVKIFGCESPWSFPGRQHFAFVIMTRRWRDPAHSAGLCLERTLGSLRVGSPDFNLCTFFLCGLALCPVANLSCESHYMLSTVSPSRDSLSMTPPHPNATGSKLEGPLSGMKVRVWAQVPIL